MKSKKVIKRSNLPVRAPLVETITVITILNYWNAPESLWTIVLCCYSILWSGFFIELTKEEPTDIFKDDDRI